MNFFLFFCVVKRIKDILQKIINWNIFIINFMIGFYFLIFFGCVNIEWINLNFVGLIIVNMCCGMVELSKY